MTFAFFPFKKKKNLLETFFQVKGERKKKEQKEKEADLLGE